LMNGNWSDAGITKAGHLSGGRVVGGGPPWLIAAHQKLLRLEQEQGASGAELAPVAFNPEVGTVHDALTWADGQLLLATDTGLHVFDPKCAKLGKPPPTLPKSFIRALCKDGQ